MSSRGKTGKIMPGGSAKYPNPKDKAKKPGGQAESPQERKERIRRIRKEHPELR